DQERREDRESNAVHHRRTLRKVVIQKPEVLADRFLSEGDAAHGERDGHGEEKQRRPPQQKRPGPPGQKRSDAESEEGADEDEVGEVRQDADLGAHPADQRQLLKQDHEGSSEERERGKAQLVARRGVSDHQAVIHYNGKSLLSLVR